jgi:DNA-binding transcriptional MerR regulator
MNLIKIKNVSDNYGITAKTLRYYEEKGLIKSVRNENYAYRSYDEQTIKKLEQILVLRRLSISVKDIKRIFDTSGSEIVLEVLGKKADDIDEEVALLHELKEIILKFIVQIKQADFSKDSDVKMLYEKANEIEGQLTNADNAVDLGRLVEVSDKLAETAEARILSANDVSVLKNFSEVCSYLKEIEKFCVSGTLLKSFWFYYPFELKEVKWLDMKDMIHACEEAARLTAEISAALGEPRGELDLKFKGVVTPLPETFSIEELASYITGFKKNISIANSIINYNRESHIDYVIEADPEEAIEVIRKDMKEMTYLCKDIAGVMEKIKAAINDIDSKLNRSAEESDSAVIVE